MCVPIIGALVSGIGSIMSGMAQAAGYEAQAKSQDMQAQAQRNAGSYDSARQAEKVARVTGQQITGTAAMGVDLSGSPVDVIVDSQTEGNLDKAAIRTNWQQKANISNYDAKISRMNAGQATMGGFIGALSPIVGGLGRMSSGFTGTSGAFG